MYQLLNLSDLKVLFDICEIYTIVLEFVSITALVTTKRNYEHAIDLLQLFARYNHFSLLTVCISAGWKECFISAR